MPVVRPLSELDSDALVALWNAAYGGYVVPLNFDRAALERHVRRSGADLQRSVAGAVDGEDFGLSLVAFREDRAWIGGFGVGEPFRRRGLASWLMNAHVERIEAQGANEVWLEVVDTNPAREVYRRSGFSDVRALRMFEGHPVAGDPGELIDSAELARLHAALNVVRPAWRRCLPTLADSIALEAVSVIGLGESYAVALDQGVRVHVLDAAAPDLASARALLGAVAARYPGVEVRLVDEPGDSPLVDACEVAGMRNPLNQIEMVRR